MIDSIYKYVADSDAFDSLTLSDRREYDSLRMLRGQPAAKGWKPIKVKEVKVGRKGDFPRLTGHLPVFSERAVTHLRELIDNAVEFLPLNTPAEPYYIVNTLDVLDCLDKDASVIEWLDEHRILDIDEYVFKADRLQGKDIFRISGHALAFVYVSAIFKSAVDSAKLEGLIFEQLPAKKIG